MAAELAGLFLGAVSLLAGFKGAVDGLQLLSDIYHSFGDASFYGAKFEIEKQRLHIWGSFFGFNDQDECEKLRGQPEVAQSLVLYILKEFQDATTSLEKLTSKYGLKLVDTGVKTTLDAHTKLNPKSELLDLLAQDQQKYNAKLKWWKKGMPWVLDLPKFEKLLDRLEYLNDSLERIVPRVDLTLLTQGLASFVVPRLGQSLSYLQTLKSSSQQYVAMCASANQIKLSSTVLSQVPEVPWDAISSRSVMESLANGSNRELAQYHDASASIIHEVIIDWKEPNLSLTVSEREETLKRIKGMCLLFREVSQDPMNHFRILPCLGLVEDSTFAKQYPGQKRHGFVFSFPTPNAGVPGSLYQSFTTLQYVPIGHRFRLAQNLASALFLHHSSRWLHKDIRSQNVALFRPKQLSQPPSTEHITTPFLTGFAYSRPDAQNQLSLERPKVKDSVDFYRHPDFEKGHSRLNDIYSLGVVLFEIGHWKSIDAICDGLGWKFGKETEVRDFLTLNCANGGPLGARMGAVYSSVVYRCLMGDFGVKPSAVDSSELVKAFWSLVLRELDSCRA